jgi:signal peptidase I
MAPISQEVSMSPVAAVDPAPSTLVEPEQPYSRWRLLAGVLGRVWLWFVVGCLLVTFVPILFGWRPYVIVSGSMAPRIKVGDVILASPEHNAQRLLGHVTVFNDPDRPGHIKSHRVIKINPDGTMVTKGDANPTPDGDPVQISAVRGIGRLLVRWVGLPLIWLTNGQWLKLILFLLSLALAAVGVASDHEGEDDPAEPDPEDDDSGSGDVPDLPSNWPGSQATPTQIAATRPLKLPGGLQRIRQNPLLAKLAMRGGIVALGSAILLIPTTFAAFAATTTNSPDTWSVPNWDYTTQVNALGPYLYWKLDETGTVTTTAADSSGNGRTGQYNGNQNPNGTATYFTRGVAGAMVTDVPSLAVTLNNANSCINTTSATLITAPAALTEIIWFKAPAGYATGGKLAGFEKPRVGVAVPATGTYDRHLYMDGNGRVWFGVYNATYITLESTAALNDGNWHMAVGTVGATGTRLYIDGVLQAANAANTVGEATTGVFRAGCGNLAGWGGSWTGGNSPGTDATVTANRAFRGSLDEYTVYASQLTATQIAFLYWIR